MPNRGVIIDRNGVVLAHNYSRYTLEINAAARSATSSATIDELARSSRSSRATASASEAPRGESKNFESLPIRTRLTDEEVARFAVNRYRFPGVEIKARLFRQYPYGRDSPRTCSATSAASTTTTSSGSRPTECSANYKGSDYIGKVGVEPCYERELHGTTGVEEVEVDAGGRGVRTLARTPPDLGQQPRADARHQAAGGRRARVRRSSAARWSRSSRRPATCSRSCPSRASTRTSSSTASTRELGGANNVPDKPLINRPLPAPIRRARRSSRSWRWRRSSSASARRDYTISDPGFFSFPGVAHRFRDDKPGGHGAVDMYKSIVVSCDTYYYGSRTTPTSTRCTASCRSSASARRPASTSRASSAGCCRRANGSASASAAASEQKWYPGDTSRVGIGQGYNSHAAAARARDRDARQRRRRLPAAPREATSSDARTGETRAIEPQPTAHASTLQARTWVAAREARDGRRQQGRRHRGARRARAPRTPTAARPAPRR